MATSSKVQFKLDVLRQKSLEAIDERIAQKQAELDELGSPEAESERLKQWRANQETRIIQLHAQLGSIDNVSLSRFNIEDLPDSNSWERSRLERELSRMKSDRARIIAKSESLVPDEEGNVSLTKTQLKEFFEL